MYGSGSTQAWLKYICLLFSGFSNVCHFLTILFFLNRCNSQMLQYCPYWPCHYTPLMHTYQHIQEMPLHTLALLKSSDFYLEEKGTLPNPLASYIRHLIHAGCYLDNEWSKCSQEMFLQPKSQPWSTKEFCISSTVSSNDWLQNFLFLLIWKCTFWAFHVQLYTT